MAVVNPIANVRNVIKTQLDLLLTVRVIIFVGLLFAKLSVVFLNSEHFIIIISRQSVLPDISFTCITSKVAFI